MAGASARDDGDLLSSIGRRATVDDFIVHIQGDGWVCNSEAAESRRDEVGRIVDEVFGGHDADLFELV